MKSIENRVARLEKKAEFETAPPVEVRAQIILATTREEALAMQSLPPVAPPVASRIKVVATGPIDAATYLARHSAPPAIQSPTNEREEA
jgi:hypothetical protein